MLLETIIIKLMGSALKSTFHEFVPVKLNNAKCSKKGNMKSDTSIAKMNLFSDENEYAGKIRTMFPQLKGKTSRKAKPQRASMFC